jgi:hypothetical protein
MKNTFLAQAFIFGLTSLIPAMPSLAKQACVRIQNGQVICGEQVPNNTPVTNKPSEQKSVQTRSGISFTLNGCQKSNVGLICAIAVQNTTDYDKRVRISTYQSTLMDSEGNQYKASSNSALARITTLPPKLTIATKLLFRPSGNLFNNSPDRFILSKIHTGAGFGS